MKNEILYNLSLDTIFDEIVECMYDSIELYIYEDNRRFDFCFEKYGYTITCNGCVGGEWNDNGNNGFTEPIEYYLENGWGRINKLEIYFTDSNTDEETYFDQESVMVLKKRLENNLNDFMSNYC